MVENVRIYHDLGYIFGIGEYLRHIILNAYGGEQKPLMHLHPLTTAYKCLQHISKDLLNFVKLRNFPNFGVAEYIAYLRDLQHKISKCLRWRTCCFDEFVAQFYWQESSMKYSSNIGAVVIENVRIYHDLGYILVICEYLQHKILKCLRR